jgi:hypothetical protein
VPSYRVASLLHDPEPEIGELLRLAEGDALQLDLPCALVAEQADASAEEHGRHVEHDLIEQIGLKALSAEAGAEDPDVLVARGGLRGCHGLLNRIRGEADPRVPALFGWAVGEHEDLPLVGPVVDPIDAVPSLGCQLVPASSGEDGPDPAIVSSPSDVGSP